MAAILKEETVRCDLHPEDAIFVLDDGRPLTAEVYRKVWQQARAVPQAHELDSPLGRHVSALHSDPGFTLRKHSRFLPRTGARGSAAIDAVFV